MLLEASSWWPFAAAQRQGDVNAAIVQSAVVMKELGRWSHLSLRYFSLVEHGLFACRAGDGGWNTNLFDTYLLALDGSPEMIIEDDYSVSQGLILRKFGARYYAYGGEDIQGDDDYLGASDKRDGIRGLVADSIEALRGGVWMRPDHRALATVLRGDNDGCMTARHANGVCEFDGKISVVRVQGRYHLYARSNLKMHGGRWVQVATSSSGPFGPFGRFRQIEIAGYDRAGPGNIYFLAADANPLDAYTMIGLMPVNLGRLGEGNGDGESFIGLSLSCDGEHWSELTKLVWSVGREGRTYDHPVDGLSFDNGVVTLYLHRDVPHISPRGGEGSSLVAYELNTAALKALTLSVRSSLRGCEGIPAMQAMAPQSPPAPSPPPRPSLPPPTNTVFEREELGSWGGTCTCPDGHSYEVADVGDWCGHLACVGGVSGGCNRFDGPWAHRQVVCAPSSPLPPSLSPSPPPAPAPPHPHSPNRPHPSRSPPLWTSLPPKASPCGPATFVTTPAPSTANPAPVQPTFSQQAARTAFLPPEAPRSVQSRSADAATSNAATIMLGAAIVLLGFCLLICGAIVGVCDICSPVANRSTSPAAQRDVAPYEGETDHRRSCDGTISDAEIALGTEIRCGASARRPKRYNRLQGGVFEIGVDAEASPANVGRANADATTSQTRCEQARDTV